MENVWYGLRLKSNNSNGSKSSQLPQTSVDLANELNSFYNRFDKSDDFLRRLKILEKFYRFKMTDVFRPQSRRCAYIFPVQNAPDAFEPDGNSCTVFVTSAGQLALIFNFNF